MRGVHSRDPVLLEERESLLGKYKVVTLDILKHQLCSTFFNSLNKFLSEGLLLMKDRCWVGNLASFLLQKLDFFFELVTFGMEVRNVLACS